MEETIKKRKIKKEISLEIMRIFAIFFVIFNHTGGDGYYLFLQQEKGGLLFWIYLFLSVFCKFSVPLFLAVSGALMLNREEKITVLWKKRILRMGIVLVVFSLFYYLCDFNFENKSIKEFVLATYVNTIIVPLWYLYMYIAYLISLPFLRAMVSGLKEKYYYYMIGIVLFFNGILPICEYLLWEGKSTMNGNMKPYWLMANIVLYPCIGYFLYHKVDREKIGKKLPFLWLINIAAIMISCYMTYYKGKIAEPLTEHNFETFYGNFVLINCITIFLTIQYFFRDKKFPELMEKFIISMGGCTFGIYLLHIFVKSKIFMNNFLTVLTYINYMFAVLVQCFIIMIVSYLLVLILKQIPGAKKFLG